MERPKSKDKEANQYIDYLLDRISIYEKSPLLSSYIAVKATVDEWNKRIAETQIDIIDEKNKDTFGMVHKYFTEMKPYLELLEYIRSKMTDVEKKTVDEQLKGANWAERAVLGTK